MASNFPASSIDSFTTKVDGTDYPTAAHQNDLQNAVVAIQTKVGVNGSANTDSLDYKVANMLSIVYPIGSVYTNKTVSTNPATLFGFGTWVAIAGRVVVGLDATQTEFDTAGETGGAKTSAHTHPGVDHLHGFSGGTSWSDNNHSVESGSGSTVADDNHAHTFSGTTGAADRSLTSGSTAPSVLQPYVVCYVWERTA